MAVPKEKEHRMKRFAIATLLAASAAAGFAQNSHGLPPGIAKKLEACSDCGTVQQVRKEKRKGEGGAVGIVAGAAAGGLVGNQFGKGNGRTLATVGGAVAGGFAGNEVQKHVTSKEVFVTTVRMKDGSLRTFEQEKAPAWKAGSVVRVNGKRVALES
jgi:outer membrane lipoprotein SlyB